MVTDNHYRWDFIQLSTDEKPTPATSPKVADGSTLYTSDDSKLYIWYKDQWYEKEATGGGGGGGGVIKDLTADDLDFPVANPTGIALWNLDAGVYRNATDSNMFLNYSSTQSSQKKTLRAGDIFTVLSKRNYNGTLYTVSQVGLDSYYDAEFIYANGSGLGSVLDIVSFKKVVDNLTTTSTGLYVLDAHQGYVLKGLIDAIQTETFTFTLTDGTTVTKNMCYKAS